MWSFCRKIRIYYIVFPCNNNLNFCIFTNLFWFQIKHSTWKSIRYICHTQIASASSNFSCTDMEQILFFAVKTNLLCSWCTLSQRGMCPCLLANNQTTIGWLSTSYPHQHVRKSISGQEVHKVIEQSFISALAVIISIANPYLQSSLSHVIGWQILFQQQINVLLIHAAYSLCHQRPVYPVHP